jgi:uncharacterized protein YndB with AHSA1/START domain
VLDVTGTCVDVEMTILAAPEIVWDLISDITRVPEWSPECVHTAWLGRVTGAPSAGACFTARNRARDGSEWTVTCQVTEAERPRAFAWVVRYGPDLDGPDGVSSFWRCDVEPVSRGGTRIHESFRHGPGGSRLRTIAEQRPDSASGILERRRRQLRENITATLAAMKAVAEGASPGR